jgi:hypothetical protein
MRHMHLPYMRRAAPEVLATARSQRWDPAEVLKVLLGEEVAGRERHLGSEPLIDPNTDPDGTAHAGMDWSAGESRYLWSVGHGQDLLVRGTRSTGGGSGSQSGLVQPRGSGRAGASSSC